MFIGADDELTGKLRAQAHSNHQLGSQELDLRVSFAYTEKRSQVNFEILRFG